MCFCGAGLETLDNFSFFLIVFVRGPAQCHTRECSRERICELHMIRKVVITRLRPPFCECSPSLSLFQVWPPLLAKDWQRQVPAEARGENVVLVASPAHWFPRPGDLNWPILPEVQGVTAYK